MPAPAHAPSVDADRNEVVLVGRVTGPAVAKELPSGDRLALFRLVVTRPPGGSRVGAGLRRPTVDTFDCVAWGAGVQRSACSWHKGDVVEVVGALRRRFWRSGAGPASLCEVEVAKARRLSRAGS